MYRDDRDRQQLYSSGMLYKVLYEAPRLILHSCIPTATSQPLHSMSKLNSTERLTTEYQLKCGSQLLNINSTADDDGDKLLQNEDNMDLDKETVPIATVIVVSVICNILMLYALYRTPHLRTVQNIFTVNLGLTDLCTTVIILPLWIITTISAVSPFMCSLTGLLTVILLSVSIATLACISLDRHLSICYALQYPSEITSRRVYLIVGYIWMQGLITAGTPLVGWGKYTFKSIHVPVCLPDWSYDKTHTLFMFTIGLLIPFVIMVYSYSKIMQTARRQAKHIETIQLQLVHPALYDRLRESPSSTSLWSRQASVRESPPVSPKKKILCSVTYASDTNERPSLDRRLSCTANIEHEAQIKGDFPGMRRNPSFIRRLFSESAIGYKNYSNVKNNAKTIRTVFLVVGVFFICWCPYVCTQAWYMWDGGDGIPYGLDYISTLLIFTSCAVNPIVFMSLNREFRRALKLMLARWFTFLGYTKVAQRLRLGDHTTSALETMRMQSRVASGDSGVELEAGANNGINNKVTNQNNSDNNRLLHVPGSKPVIEQQNEDNSSLLADFEDIKEELAYSVTNAANDEVNFYIEEEEEENKDIKVSNNTDSIVPVIVLPGRNILDV